jgi:hypothetical protein
MSIRLFIFLFNLRHLIISDGCIDAEPDGKCCQGARTLCFLRVILAVGDFRWSMMVELGVSTLRFS